MARIRTIKPEFYQDEDLALVSEPAFILAAGLLNHADDEGYFKANPGLIKAAVFPLREPSVSIHGMLTELSNAGYIRLTEGADGKQYGLITNFKKHQYINRPTPSKIKDIAIFTETSVSNHGALSAGKEQGTGKGKENTSGYSPEAAHKKSARKQKTDYTPDFETAWSAYPKRAGNNPKAEAFKEWRARLSDGEVTATMLEGVQRYAAFIEITGKVGTEFVLQAATFFGPSRAYEQDWNPPATISQTDDWRVKAKRLGLEARDGESWQQFEARVKQA